MDADTGIRFVRLDWKDKEARGPFALYFAWGFVDLTISSWVYWILGTSSCKSIPPFYYYYFGNTPSFCLCVSLIRVYAGACVVVVDVVGSRVAGSVVSTVVVVVVVVVVVGGVYVCATIGVVAVVVVAVGVVTVVVLILALLGDGATKALLPSRPLPPLPPEESTSSSSSSSSLSPSSLPLVLLSPPSPSVRGHALQKAGHAALNALPVAASVHRAWSANWHATLSSVVILMVVVGGGTWCCLYS